MTEEQLYHINAKQEVKPCQAKKRACRYSENPHGKSMIELQEKIDTQNADIYKSFSTLQKKKLEPQISANNKAESENVKNIKNLLQRINNFNDQHKIILEIGKLFEQEIQDRLDFGMDDQWQRTYDVEKLRKIGAANRKLLSELTQTGSEFDNVVGLNIEEIQQEARILPSGAIKSFEGMNIHSHTHTHIVNKFNHNSIHLDSEGLFYKSPNNPNDLYVGLNEKTSLSHNVVYLHELTHAVQSHMNILNSVSFFKSSEEQMYDSAVASYSSSPSGFDSSVRNSFPDFHMGKENKRELFPMATQKFFYPEESNVLYGKARKKTADSIRQWVAGYWLVVDKQLENHWG